LSAVIAEDGSCAKAYWQIGLVYGFTGLFDESLDALKRAVELEPENVEIRNDLAMTYAMLGMYEEAKAEFLAVLEIDPSNEKARRELVYF
jgi:tetratricopeptide (TPR) repeat protein